MRVLVVDDEEASRYLLESVLSASGHEVVTAVDGLDGLEKARASCPDIVVTDILMPRMDGYKMCVELRSDETTRGVPIIVYTASFGDVADRRLAESIGVDEFIIKPTQPNFIVAEVERLAAASSSGERVVLAPEDAGILKQYGERISNKLYEKLLELEGTNADLKQALASLSEEIDAKNALVEELSRVVAKEQQAEEALLISQERYAAAMRGVNDGIWDWDLDTGSFFGSPRFRAMLSLEESEPLVREEQWLARILPEDVEHVRFEIDLHLRGLTTHFKSEYRVKTDDGSVRWMRSRGQVLRRETGQAYRMAGSLTDITEAKHQEEELLRNALYDELTGLPNRTLYGDRLNFLYQRRERNPEYLFAVLYVDLDRFKSVNESMGRAKGDILLKQAAGRLGNLVSTGDTVSRFSGDEFAVLLDDIPDSGAADRMAEKIVSAFEAPFDLVGESAVVTASVGISVPSASGKEAEELLRDAETALYRAKEAGRCRFEVFDAVMHAAALKAIKTEAELRVGIDRGELEPYFQPIVSLATGQVIGCEALARWNHPERGLLGPYEFVPIAEDTGLVVPMGLAVMRAACERNKEWQDAGLPPVRVSVNLSARQFAQPSLLDTIRDVLRTTGLPPEYLTLEVTESVIMADPREAAIVLASLHEIGVGLSVDDFGTGYSSLSYLKKFPFTTLKIDRSFVMDIPNDLDDMTIVDAIVGLAHSLKMSVTAEGVETIEQVRYLRGLGCDEIQGFLVSEPVAAADFVPLLAAGQVLADDPA